MSLCPRLATPFHLMFAGVNPLGYLRWRARGAEPFRVQLPQVGEVLFTAAESGARQVFQAPPGLLESPQPELIAPLIGPGSLLMLSGERHRKERKILMPSLHGDRMRAYGSVIRAAVLAELNGPSASRGTLRATKFSFAVTTRVIEQTVFGGQREGEFASAMTELLLRYTTALMLSPVLRHERFPPWRRFLATKERFDQLLRQQIERRRDEGASLAATEPGRTGATTPAGSDILGALLQARYEDGSALEEADLLDELRTIVVAGHETTAAALAWALYEVARNEQVQAQLHAELAPLGSDPDPESLARLPYLNAVCQETLRLHPSVPLVLRRLTAPATFFGQALEPGAMVGVALSALHADPALWPDPTRFSPERFLDEPDGSSGTTHKTSPFALAPFGGGNRRCPGASFAGYELHVALGVLLSRTHVRGPRLSWGLWAIAKGIATRPNREIRLRVTDVAAKAANR